MRHLLLGLLLGGPATLYELQHRFAAGLAHIYGPSMGGIHRALQQLLAQGAVSVDEEHDGGRRRKRYAVTPTGREQWSAWMREPEPREDLETGVLARVFLLGHLPGGQRRAVLESLRDRVEASAAELSAVRDAEVDSTRFSRATLDLGRRSHALLTGWLGELIADDELEDAP